MPIAVSSIERQVLTARARRARGEQRDVLRARIVLGAADGQSNAAIARKLAITEDTVRRWRGRFAAERVPGLDDRRRAGRPRTFSDVAAIEVKAMARALPAETGVPLARWSSTELAAEAVTRGLVDTVSAATVRRWLTADAIKPWQCRSWIFPRDPDFAAKARRVLDLYDRHWDGQSLGDDEYVISADEKSQLQALHRHRPDLPPAPGRVPVHASWLNQVEIFFSIVQRKVIKPQDFDDLDVLADRLLAFQDRYNATAVPFEWRFTRKSLDRLLERLALHDQQAA